MTHWIVYPVENIPHSYQNNILNNICFIPSLYLHLPTTCAWGFSVKLHWHSLVEVIFSSHDLCWRNVNTRGLRTIYQGLDSEIEYSNTTHQRLIWLFKYMTRLAKILLNVCNWLSMARHFAQKYQSDNCKTSTCISRILRSYNF